MPARVRGSTMPLVLLSQRILVLLTTLSAGALLGACEDEVADEIGTPCDIDDDCSSELVCDLHAGQGTCQVPHDH
jgi:hypothetical protein